MHSIWMRLPACQSQVYVNVLLCGCMLLCQFYFWSPRCLTDSLNPLHTEPTVYHYTCPQGVKLRGAEVSKAVSVTDCCSNHTQFCFSVSNGSFSEGTGVPWDCQFKMVECGCIVATLMFTTGEDAIKHLFSRQTQKEFGVGWVCLCKVWLVQIVNSNNLQVSDHSLSDLFCFVMLVCWNPHRKWTGRANAVCCTQY